jgi:cytochrome c-type biogenesis protein
MAVSTTLSLAAGAAAVFNPCGFAMLPAYLTSFVAAGETAAKPLPNRLLAAVKVGGAVTAGFGLVFGIIGFAVASVREFVVGEAGPWMTLVIGVALFALGIAMLRGFQPKFTMPTMQTNTASKTSRAMFLYGVSYALVSLGCTIGPFMAQVANAASGRTLLERVLGFLMYVLGMGIVVIMLTMAAALSQQGFIRNMRKVLPYINRISAGLLILTGAYFVYYSSIEFQQRSESGVARGAGLSNQTFKLSSKFTELITNNIGSLTLLLVAIVGVTLISIVLRKRPHSAESATPTPSTETASPGGSTL